MIQHLDEIDGDADCDEDDAADAFSFSWYASGGRGPGCPVSEPDSGVEDDPRGFDLEDDYCLAHEDFGTMGCITPREKKEVRRVKVACREAQRAKH